MGVRIEKQGSGEKSYKDWERGPTGTSYKKWVRDLLPEKGIGTYWKSYKDDLLEELQRWSMEYWRNGIRDLLEELQR